MVVNQTGAVLGMVAQTILRFFVKGLGVLRLVLRFGTTGAGCFGCLLGAPDLERRLFHSPIGFALKNLREKKTSKSLLTARIGSCTQLHAAALIDSKPRKTPWIFRNRCNAHPKNLSDRLRQKGEIIPERPIFVKPKPLKKHSNPNQAIIRRSFLVTKPKTLICSRSLEKSKTSSLKGLS